MAKKFEYIQVPKGSVPAIMAEVGCSKPSVYAALNGITTTPMADRIRDLAVNKFNGRKASKNRFVNI